MPNTTPNFGFEYPLATDNLSDGAQSIQDFATTADTTFADLKGGTTGQYLTKTTNTNMDFSWVTLPAVPTLPVAGSTYYFSNLNNHSGGSIAAGSGGMGSTVMYLVPIFIPTDMTIDRIGIEVTAAAASSTIRLGLYTYNAGAPGTLIADFGTVSSATTGLKELTVSQAVSSGIVYAAYRYNGSLTTNVRRISGGWNTAFFVDTQARALDPSTVCWQNGSAGTGALPSSAGATITTSGVAHSNAIITLRRA